MNATTIELPAKELRTGDVARNGEEVIAVNLMSDGAIYVLTNVKGYRMFPMALVTVTREVAA